MAKFFKKKQVLYSPECMFALVADIEKYPDFLPMCKKIEILGREEFPNKTFLTANMIVGYKSFQENFVSKVFLYPNENRIDVSYVDGPFTHLENKWIFLETNDTQTCDIEFYIEYQFKNRLFDFVLKKMVEQMFVQFTECFEVRAQKIYGASRERRI